MKNSIKELIISVAEKAGFQMEKFGSDCYKAYNGIEICNFYLKDRYFNVLLRQFDKCIFSKATDEESIELMTEWAKEVYHIGEFKPASEEFLCDWNLNLEFARLVLERGYLIKDTLTRILSLESDSILSRAYNNLISVGVLWLDNGIEIAKKILKCSVDDSRDGIFTAVWKSNDMSLNIALLECFEKWIEEDQHYGSGTGERGFLSNFLVRWIATGMFSLDRLKRLIEWNSKESYRKYT